MLGAVFGGIAFLGMFVGGLWIWIRKSRSKNQTGATEWSKPELPANADLSSPLHRDCIHEIHGAIKGTPELPAPNRYELAGDDGAREMPALD